MKPWVVQITGGLSMMEISTKSRPGFGQRCHTLNVASLAVRQRATQHGGDIETWRLSRLMRDADTDEQVNIAEQKYTVWLQTN
jgi:hypothetical protein